MPQLYADIDRVKVKSLDVPLDVGLRHAPDVARVDLCQRLQPVRPDLPGPGPGRPAVPRSSPTTSAGWRSATGRGRWCRWARWSTIEKRLGPQIITRYNLYPSASITGEAAPGFSSGQALELMEQMAERKLPPSMGYEWTGMSYQEKKVGSQAIYVFAPGGAAGLPRAGRPVRELD